MRRVFPIKDLKALEDGTGTFFYRHVGPKEPKTPPFDNGQRGGQAPALRENQDPEGAPTVLHRDREVSPTGKPSLASRPDGSN